MVWAPGRRSRRIGIVVLALALAGCGSAARSPSPKHLSAAAGSSSTSTTAAPGSGTTTSTTTHPGISSYSSHDSGSTSTTTLPSGNSNGPQPADNGTYTYDQTGCFTESSSPNCSSSGAQQYPAQGTEMVDAPIAQGTGSWSQVWNSYLESSQPPSSTAFSITPGGIAITSEVIRLNAEGQTVTFTCTLSPPVEVLDWPPTVGHQFSGSGNCTSPNNSYGSFSVTVSGSITGTQSTSIGGSPSTAYVVSTTATTSGSVTSTTTETDWFDPGPDIDLYQSSQQSGSYEGLVSFASTIARTLVSTHPS